MCRNWIRKGLWWYWNKYMSVRSKWQGFRDSEEASHWRLRSYDLEIHRVVAAVTGPRTGPSGVSNSGKGWRFFTSPKLPHWLWGPPGLLFNRYRCSSSEVKLPRRELYHWTPSRADVQNKWSYTSTPSVGFRGVDMDNFTVFFLGNSIRPETLSSHLCSVLSIYLYPVLLTGLFQKCVA